MTVRLSPDSPRRASAERFSVVLREAIRTVLVWRWAALIPTRLHGRFAR